MTNTHNYDIEVDTDWKYYFNVSSIETEGSSPAYNVSTWLQSNIAGLTDDDDNIIFSKVNTGFNSESLKTFGKKPTCDVYINRVNYDGTFENHLPSTVDTIVIFYMKGANNVAYMKAAQLHDYLVKEFINNRDWRFLQDVVRDTIITNSSLMTQPINKKWGVMGTLELSHQLY